MARKRWRCGWLMLAALLAATPVLAKKRKPVKQVVIKEVTRVEGKIQKPEVWYLLPRSKLNFEVMKLEKKLVPRIGESIKKAPF